MIRVIINSPAPAPSMEQQKLQADFQLKLTILVTAFGIFGLIFVAWVFRSAVATDTEKIVRLVIVVIVVCASLILIAGGYSTNQTAPEHRPVRFDHRLHFGKRQQANTRQYAGKWRHVGNRQHAADRQHHRSGREQDLTGPPRLPGSTSCLCVTVVGMWLSSSHPVAVTITVPPILTRWVSMQAFGSRRTPCRAAISPGAPAPRWRRRNARRA